MLCLIADVGGIGSSDYKIPLDVFNPAEGTRLTWNKDQSVVQISRYLKSFTLTLRYEANASKTSIILAFPVLTKQCTY